ncbi:MAG: hypothetical protein NVS3B20_07320 [Polyangiales bacterium]
MARPTGNASVLGESTHVRGRVGGKGDLEVRGRIEGEIDVVGALVIEVGAVVRASVRGESVVVRGALLGDIDASHSIALDASARVVGNLRSPRIAIALGAQVRGELDMGHVGAVHEGDGHRAVASTPRAAAFRAATPTPVAQPTRAPLPPARSVVVTRKLEASAPAVVNAINAVSSNDFSAKKTPPEPIVPALRKGAKAAPKRKNA